MAHLGKGVLHPGSGFGNALVAPFLAFAQGFARLGLALDVLAIAQDLEHLAALFAGVATVGINIAAGVVLIENFIKVRAVVLAGCAGGDLANELVAHIHADAQLVAVVALAVLLGMGGVQVFLPALGLVPVAGDLALIQLLFVLFCEVLDGCRHQGGIDDLPAPRQVAALQQLAVHCLEQGRHAINAQALLVMPDGVAIWDVGAIGQQAKALVAHAVKQLVFHLLVAELVEILQDQDAHHDRGGIRRTSTLGGIPSGQQLINDPRQVVKVNVSGNDLQGIAQGLDLVLARGIGEEVQLDGAARLRFGFAHAVIVALAGVASGGEVFRGSQANDCSRPFAAVRQQLEQTLNGGIKHHCAARLRRPTC